MMPVPAYLGSAKGWRSRLRRTSVRLRSIPGTRNYNRFVIVGIARTGSTMLISSLNAHPQALAFGELFRTPTAIGWDIPLYSGFASKELLRLFRNEPCRFLEAAVFRRWPSGTRAVGFKLFYYHAREAPYSDVWGHLARRNDILVLHVKRRNILAQYLSLRLAHDTNVWYGSPSLQPPTQPLPLDVEDCRRHFAWVRSLEKEADSLFSGHRLLQVEYERLADDQAGELARVQEFLGLEQRDLAARTVRQRKVPLSQAIANYDELKEAFADTEWSPFFSETFE
jgi:LPS sulfotransferase NodH